MPNGPEYYIPPKNYGTAQWLKERLKAGAYHQLLDQADYDVFYEQLVSLAHIAESGKVAIQCLFAETQEELEDPSLINWVAQVYDYRLDGEKVGLDNSKLVATTGPEHALYELPGMEDIPILTLCWSDINWAAFNPQHVNALNN